MGDEDGFHSDVDEKIKKFQEGLLRLLNEARFEGMHDDDGSILAPQVLDFYLGLAARCGDALEVSKDVYLARAERIWNMGKVLVGKCPDCGGPTCHVHDSKRVH